MNTTAAISENFQQLVLKLDGDEFQHMGLTKGCYLFVDTKLNPKKGSLVVIGTGQLGGASAMRLAIYHRNLFYSLEIGETNPDIKKMVLIGTVTGLKEKYQGDDHGQN